ncbi:unnamed protein product, partial [Musa textilis]
MRGKVLLPGPPRQTRIRGESDPYALETDGNSWPGRIESIHGGGLRSKQHPSVGWLSF